LFNPLRYLGYLGSLYYKVDGTINLYVADQHVKFDKNTKIDGGGFLVMMVSLSKKNTTSNNTT
jgi:hypothetical protein